MIKTMVANTKVTMMLPVKLISKGENGINPNKFAKQNKGKIPSAKKGNKFFGLRSDIFLANHFY